MAIAVFPPSGGGGIKTVQRGSAAGAGNVTITGVDITKSFVNVYGTASSGTVAASASVSTSGNISSNLNDSGVSWNFNQNEIRYPSGATRNVASANQITDFFSPYRYGYTQTLTGSGTSSDSGNLSGGSNNLVAAIVQGYLSNSTTLIVSGPCRWEVVEFN
jgi:hypothetical protein